MQIRVRAEKTGSGILLTGIASQADAERVCSFFRQQGTGATIPALSSINPCVLLVSITMERFTELIRGSEIELML